MKCPLCDGSSLLFNRDNLVFCFGCEKEFFWDGVRNVLVPSGWVLATAWVNPVLGKACLTYEEILEVVK